MSDYSQIHFKVVNQSDSPVINLIKVFHKLDYLTCNEILRR